MRTLCIFASLLLLGSGQTLTLAQNGTVANSGGDLELALRQPKTTVSMPSLRVELRNVSDHALLLNLGASLANGRMLHPDAIRLLLTEPHGRQLRLDFTQAGIAPGRVDPMVVPLPAGATFSFPLDLRNYSAPAQKIWKLNLPRGQYTLSADFTGVNVPIAEAGSDMKSISTMHFWTGRIRSNTVTLTLPKGLSSALR